MSVRAERVTPKVNAGVNPAKVDEVVVNFDAVQLKAPFLLRCGAFLIDYILFVSVPIIALILGRTLGDGGGKLLNSELSNAGWLLAILIAISNFIIFPMFTGQSIGKMLTGLQIVRIDGKAASLTNLLVRHLVGYLLTALTFGLGFLFSIFSTTGRTVQDLVAGTVVVYGKRRIK